MRRYSPLIFFCFFFFCSTLTACSAPERPNSTYTSQTDEINSENTEDRLQTNAEDSLLLTPSVDKEKRVSSERKKHKSDKTKKAKEETLTTICSDTLSAGDSSTFVPASTSTHSIPTANTLSPESNETSLSESPVPNSSVVEPSATSPLRAEHPTKKRFMPTARRIDREIDKHKFIYKKEWLMSMGATYATINSDNADLWVILDKINLDGTVATIKPSIAYCYRDNRAFGLRFGYTYIDGHLDNLDFDLGEANDISTSIGNISLTSHRYSFGFFHRTYVALDPHGRISLFGDMELSMQTGTSRFSYKSGEEWKVTNSDNLTLKAWFNPGLSVFIMPNVSTTLSFGLGGFKYTRIDQKDENGAAIGTRTASKMRFRLNLLEIGFGLNIHLWNNKKP